MDQIKILLVDDEVEFVKTLSERIQIRGFDSHVALSGEEALAVIRDTPPDVIVLDLKMPGMDGIEVLRRLKKTDPDIQVLILTGHGSEKDETEARRLGAFDYLQKPVDIETLIEYIRRTYAGKTDLAP